MDECKRARHGSSLVVAVAAHMALTMASGAHAQLTSVSGYAGDMDKVLTIQPIQVCDNDGNNCAQRGALYKDFLIETYAKAGIAVAVLPWKTVNNSTYLTGLYAGGDPPYGGSFVLPTEGASNSKKTLNAWFVKDLIDWREGTKENVTYGRVGSIGGNGLVIDSVEVMAYERSDGSIGRIDTFAHEIGHNLGLEHDKLGAGGANNLMTEGSKRTVPASTWTSDQITKAKASEFVAGSPLLTFTQAISAYVVQSNGDPYTFPSLNVRFEELPEGVHLKRMTIDLPDANLTMPGDGGRPYEYIMGYGFTSVTKPVLDHAVVLQGNFDTLLVGPKCSGDDYPLAVISCYGENTQLLWPNGHDASPPDPWFATTQGGPEIKIDFGPDSQGNDFEVGDEFTLSLLLFQHKIHEEVVEGLTWPRDFDGATITLEYDFGLVTQGVFDTSLASWSSRQVTAIGQADYAVTPFGAVYGPGEGPTVTDIPADADPDLRILGRVPEPGVLGLVSLAMLAAWRQRRRCQAFSRAPQRVLAS